MEHIIKKHETETYNPPIRRFLYNIENRATCNIKTGLYIDFLTPETTRLLRSTKFKINKDENGENLPH